MYAEGAATCVRWRGVRQTSREGPVVGGITRVTWDGRIRVGRVRRRRSPVSPASMASAKAPADVLKPAAVPESGLQADGAGVAPSAPPPPYGSWAETAGAAPPAYATLGYGSSSTGSAPIRRCLANRPLRPSHLAVRRRGTRRSGTLRGTGRGPVGDRAGRGDTAGGRAIGGRRDGTGR